jgi:hypothetical protein
MNKNYCPTLGYTFFFFVVSFFFIALTPLSYAEESIEDDVLIIEDEVIIDESDTSELEKDSSEDANDIGEGGNYFTEHFSGGIGLSYSGFIGKNKRINNFFKVRFQDEWEETGLSVAITGRWLYSQADLFFEKEVTTHNSDGSSDKETTEITRQFKAEEGQLREGYVRWSQPFFDIYAGRRTLAIGQFDAFSPVDFILPVDLTNGNISFSKLESKFPQTTLSGILYPSNKTELQFHFFPKLERDPSFSTLLEKPTTFFVTEANSSSTVEKSKAFKFPEDESQYLLRFLYTGNIIWGLTYYKGFHFFPETLTLLQGNDFIRENSYRPGEAYGFEIAVPFERYNVKYEILSYKEFYGGQECYENSTTCNAWKSYIRNKLNNNAYFEFDAYLHALGYDFRSEDWTVNLAIMHFIQSKTDEQKEAEKLNDALFSKISKENINAIPFAHFARHYGETKNQTTGFGLGFFGAAVGITLYHGYKYKESLTLGVSAEYLTYRNETQNADQIEQEEEEGKSDEQSTDITSLSAESIRLTLIYDF